MTWILVAILLNTPMGSSQYDVESVRVIGVFANLDTCNKAGERAARVANNNATLEVHKFRFACAPIKGDKRIIL